MASPGTPNRGSKWSFRRFSVKQVSWTTFLPFSACACATWSLLHNRHLPLADVLPGQPPSQLSPTSKPLSKTLIQYIS